MSDDDLPEDVLDALRRGRRVEAINRLREARGLSLKDAHDAVSAAAGEAPPPARRASTGDGPGRTVIVLVVAALAGLGYWLIVTG
jgi:hypothetical protein